MDKVEPFLFKHPGLIQENLSMVLGSYRSEISEITDFAEQMA